MANVIATARGYFGGMIREVGDKFVAPDGLTAMWFKPVDGDEPQAAPEAPAEVKTKAVRKPKAETVDAPTAALFADAPEPVRVVNAINDLTGGTQPDWISPGADI